jgi:hypothetical protein
MHQQPTRLVLIAAAGLLAAGCGGSERVELAEGDAGGWAGGGPCSPGNAQCNNCVDDDGDDLIDGDDPECTGSLDNDEGSFATGIPGDNKDTKWQDCFFDGNSGAGDDGCRYHTCCLLGAESGAECAVDSNFDPGADCPVQTQTCIDYCAPLAPPGCDCFGCCTVCDPDTNVCTDVLTNPAVAPNCRLGSIDDPEVCPPCIKNDECGGGGCEPTGCVLCPGQTPDDLPDECNNQNECPGERTRCEESGDCGEGEYCSNRCCQAVVE